jgi:hypothetical protein
MVSRARASIQCFEREIYTVPNAQKINHVARISAHRTESPTCPRGGFPAFPQTKPEVGRLSRQFLYYLEVISKACSRFSVGRMGHGYIRARDPITPSIGDPLVVAKAT